eukprot:1034596-Prymnesium_polylepis.1
MPRPVQGSSIDAEAAAARGRACLLNELPAFACEACEHGASRRRVGPCRYAGGGRWRRRPHGHGR